MQAPSNVILMATVKLTKPSPALPWKNKKCELINCLLDLVKKHGMHLKKNTKGIANEWKTLYEDFFERHQELREIYCHENGHRSMQKFYTSLMKEIQDKAEHNGQKSRRSLHMHLYISKAEELLEEISRKKVDDEVKKRADEEASESKSKDAPSSSDETHNRKKKKYPSK